MRTSMMNLVGTKVGRLTVSKFLYRGKSYSPFFECICDCGNIKTISGSHLRNIKIRSCGCLARELTAKRNYKHGMSNTKEHRAWLAMHNRCNLKTLKGYENWGGRGIKVCSRWGSFDSFLEDMGYSPTSKHSIDRIDNNGNYEPQNCRWATNKQQTRNLRSNKNYELNGVVKTLSEWCEEFNLNYGTIHNRIYSLKWCFQKAITSPIRNKQ